MAVKYQKEKLKEILEDFYNLTEIRIAVFDAFGNEILAFPEKICGLCRALRIDSAFDEKCRQSDIKAFSDAANSDAVLIYRCHYGLTEAIKAIKIKSATVGYIMFGQLADSENFNPVQRGLKGRADLESELKKLPVADGKKLAAAANIMDICSKYVLYNSYLEISYAGKGKAIKEYLKSNYQKDINVNELTRAFGLSHTYIHKIFKTEEGTGVIQYLNKIRLERAAELLKNSELTQAGICAETGINDPNYFSRAFKKRYGISPSEYRARN